MNGRTNAMRAQQTACRATRVAPNRNLQIDVERPGANAVLMMRFDSAEIGTTMSEIVAYGTAAVIEPMP